MVPSLCLIAFGIIVRSSSYGLAPVVSVEAQQATLLIVSHRLSPSAASVGDQVLGSFDVSLLFLRCSLSSYKMHVKNGQFDTFWKANHT